MSEPVTIDKDKLTDTILAARKNGEIVYWSLPGQLATVRLDDFVKQPADGMLYDLNRLEEISLSFLDNPKWVNDFAVAQVIRKLVEQRDHLTAAVRAYVAHVRRYERWIPKSVIDSTRVAEDRKRLFERMAESVNRVR